MAFIRFFTILLFTSISFSQEKDSLVSTFTDDLKVFKSQNTKTFYLKKSDGKTLFQNLKFTLNIGQYLQVLDDKNRIFYINHKGNKEQKPNFKFILCGTVPFYHCKIIETKSHFVITENETFLDYGDKTEAVKTDSISKSGIDKITFINNQKEIKYNENDFALNYTKIFPSCVIVEKENKKAILYNQKLFFYDEIIYISGLIKIKNNGKYGFFEVTDIKYKEINDFVFGLAKIVTFNNKHGFVDYAGIEYFE